MRARSARLRVRTPGDDNESEPTIVVRATIAPAVPGSGAPDIYGLTVFDPFGTIIYDFGANLMDGEGDIVVNFLP